MSVIGDFTVPAESFALERTFERVPGLTLEADRLASHAPAEVMPFVWVSGGVDDLAETLSADPDVETAEVADRLDGETLFRMRWSEGFRAHVQDMIDHHAAILRAEASEGTWTLRLRFADEAMVSAFQSHFRAEDRDLEVHSLTRPSAPRQSEFGLTADQREALAAAVRSGYFSIPRESSAEQLGEELGISANAASERVRRGTETLVESALLIRGNDSW